MPIIVKNTQYTVRPDVLDTETINQLNLEQGVIVYDKETNQLKTNDGSQWKSIGHDEETLRAKFQGYYGMLSAFYFGGAATETELVAADVDTWIDVLIDTDTNGLFDNRPTSMIEAQSNGHTGDGSTGNPVIFNLEGLTQTTFANFRASMSFLPLEDEGQLEARLLFNRHTGTTPSNDFSIEEVSLSMQNGADIDYATEPMLSFFIGDTIDTNGTNDAGKCRFQIKSNVLGTVKMRALTWYINK